jgi:hypothetical protein
VREDERPSLLVNLKFSIFDHRTRRRRCARRRRAHGTHPRTCAKRAREGTRAPSNRRAHPTCAAVAIARALGATRLHSPGYYYSLAVPAAASEYLDARRARQATRSRTWNVSKRVQTLGAAGGGPSSPTVRPGPATHATQAQAAVQIFVRRPPPGRPVGPVPGLPAAARATCQADRNSMSHCVTVRDSMVTAIQVSCPGHWQERCP